MSTWVTTSYWSPRKVDDVGCLLYFIARKVESEKYVFKCRLYFVARFILSSNSNNCCLLYFNENIMCTFTKKLKLLGDHGRSQALAWGGFNPPKLNVSLPLTEFANFDISVWKCTKCIISHKIPKKNFWGWGTAPSPDLTPAGKSWGACSPDPTP